MERNFGLIKRLLRIGSDGNVVVGKGEISAPDGQVTDNVLIGDHTVVSEAQPGAPVVISGNKLFGRTKIIIR